MIIRVIMPKATDSSVGDATDETLTSTSDEGDYSRRGFMETAASMGAAGAAAGLAGCTEQFGGGSGSKTKGEKDFIFWTMRGYIPEVTKNIKQAAKGFEKHSDSPVNVSTNVIVWNQVFPKWNASIQGQTTPNVSEMANEHAVNFGSLGATAPITDIYDSYDDWYGPMESWASWDDKKWGVPWFVETRPMYYRKDLLEKAGHSKPPKDWKELVKIGKDVVKETGNPGYIEPGARDFTTGQHTFAYTANAGGKFYSKKDGKWQVELDSAGSLFGHLFYASLKKAWNLTADGWTSQDSSATDKFFRERDAGMAHLGAEDARLARTKEHAGLRDNVGIQPMPEGPLGKRWSFRGGSCLSPFTDDVSKHDVGDLSNEFVKYMMQPDNQSDYFAASAPVFMPVRKSQEQMDLFTKNPTKLPDDWLDAFVTQAQETRRYGVYGGGQDTPFLGSVEGSTTGYSQAISAILGSNKDPKKALVGMANNVRNEANKKLDYSLKSKSEKPSLDDAPKEVQDWITGSNNTPKIWNPYE